MIYKLFQDGTEVTSATISGNQLTLSSPAEADSGDYTCTATNGAISSDASDAQEINFYGKFVFYLYAYSLLYWLLGKLFNCLADHCYSSKYLSCINLCFFKYRAQNDSVSFRL